MPEREYTYRYAPIFDDYPFEEDFCYTIEYVSPSGVVVRRNVKKPNRRRKPEPELDVGDTAAIDSFLGGFCRGAK